MLRSWASALSLSLLTTGCLSGSLPTSPSQPGPDGSTPNPPGPTTTPPVNPPALSCAPAGGAVPPTAPNGYYTSGAAVCTAAGVPHLFHGVDRPSLEFCPDSTNTGCTHLSADDLQLMASWNANVVRVALDQDRWLSSAALYDPNYTSSVDQVIQWAEAAGMDVILDLHWSDRGDLTVAMSSRQAAGNSQQQPMADVNSIEFWREVAARYRGDGRVLFELYNEPNTISWSVWLNGGTSGGYTYAGMQSLYDAIRHDAQADNVVIAGGLDWSFDLSRVQTYPIQGYNIMYASHVYKAGDSMTLWTQNFGYLAQGNIAPVILTEFGDNQNTAGCTGAWDSSVIAYANQWNISWSAWGWYVPYPTTLQSLCSFPSLIADWSGTPSVQGQVVLAALQAYPPNVVDAGSPATDDGGSAEGAGDDSAGDDGSGDEGSGSELDGALDAGTGAD